MTYQWIDFSPDLLDIVESFLDSTARRMSGCDEGWKDYYEYMINDPSIHFGKDFWVKVILENKIPIAVIALGLYEGTLTVSEFIVSPEHRGKGHGTAILRELLIHEHEIIAHPFSRALAVIFPDNPASQRAFENAGFIFESAHPDGDAWYYTYQNSCNSDENI